MAEPKESGVEITGGYATTWSCLHCCLLLMLWLPQLRWKCKNIWDNKNHAKDNNIWNSASRGKNWAQYRYFANMLMDKSNLQKINGENESFIEDAPSALIISSISCNVSSHPSRPLWGATLGSDIILQQERSWISCWVALSFPQRRGIRACQFVECAVNKS